MSTDKVTMPYHTPNKYSSHKERVSLWQDYTLTGRKLIRGSFKTFVAWHS